MNSTALTAHLLRRAGFGATATELEHAVTNGFFAAVDTLTGGLGHPDTGADAVELPTLTEPLTDLRVGAAPLPSSIRDSIGTFLPGQHRRRSCADTPWWHWGLASGCSNAGTREHCQA